MTDWARRARAAEADADAYPDDRPELLIEAAWAWGKAGEHDRGLALLDEAPLWDDPFDRGLARTARADLHHERGDQDAVRAEYALLWTEDPDRTLCEAAGDHLEAYGDLVAALRWYDRAAAQLTPSDLALLHGDDAWTASAAYTVTARRRVREALGMSADETDLLVPARPSEDALWVRSGRRRGQAREPRTVLAPFWPRAEFGPAKEVFPELFDEEQPADYWGVLERSLRDAASGLRVRLVPVRVAELSDHLERTGADAALEETRRAYAEERRAAGDVVAWPPGRNDPCWCGSAAKYKRCCLRA